MTAPTWIWTAGIAQEAVLLQLQLMAAVALGLARVPEILATIGVHGAKWVRESRDKLALARQGCVRRSNFVIRCYLPILDMAAKYLSSPSSETGENPVPCDGGAE